MARSGGYEGLGDARGQLESAGGCVRVEPFLDDDLVEFVASLRPELLFYGGWIRGLFRQALRGCIPESVLWRPDKARFEEAFRQIVEASGGFGAVAHLAEASALGDLEIVEPRAFRKRFDDLVRQPLDGRLWLEVWPVLAAEAFVRFVRSGVIA